MQAPLTISWFKYDTLGASVMHGEEDAQNDQVLPLGAGRVKPRKVWISRDHFLSVVELPYYRASKADTTRRLIKLNLERSEPWRKAAKPLERLQPVSR